MTTHQIDAFAKYQLAAAKVAHMRYGSARLAALACLAFLLVPFFGGPVGAVGLLCLIASLSWLGVSELKTARLSSLELAALYPRPNRRRVAQLPQGRIYR